MSSHRDNQSPADPLVRYHEQWLARNLRVRRLPRIPTRRVSEGGFAFLAVSTEGQARTAFWWETALARVELFEA